MMTSTSRFLGAALLALSLASCGGGGGGGDKDQGNSGTPSATPTPTPGTSQSLSLSPALLSANIAVGGSVTITTRVAVVNGALPDAQLYGLVRNGDTVFSSSVDLVALSSDTVSVSLHTLPTQVKGRLQGRLDLYVCEDASCAKPLPGAPLSVPYDINVGDVALQAYPIHATAMSVHSGESFNKQLIVSVTGIDPTTGWSATSPQPWVKVLGGTGKGQGTFNVGFKTEALTEGTQSATVVVRAANGQTVDVPVQIQVLPVSFTTLGGMPSFSAVNGAAIPAQTLAVQLNNKLTKPWTVTSTEDWLQVRRLENSTQAIVSIEPDSRRGALASGVYLADLVVSSAGVADMVLTTQLTLTPATLSSSIDTVTLGGEKGRDLSASQSLTLSLNTGSLSWPYQLSKLPNWLSASASSGSVNESGSTITLTPQGANISPGSRTETITLSSQVNGDMVSHAVTVNVNADQRRLLASEWGVALSSSPTGSTISRTLSIRENFGGPVTWTASSDSEWLQVNGNGSTGQTDASLTLTADPAKVPLEAVSYAKVTVATSTPGVEPAVVRVALWRSATGLPAMKKLKTSSFQLVADKLRPFVYARDAYGIDVFNVYTAQKVGRINGAGGSWPMSISADGSRLYALNPDNVVEADLDTLSVSGTWLQTRDVPNGGPVVPAIQAVRVNGVDVVLVNNGFAYARGRALGKSLPWGTNTPMATTRDGTILLIGSSRYQLDFSEMSGGMLFASPLGGGNSQSGPNLLDVATAEDGHHAYAAAGGGVYGSGGFLGYHCSWFDPTYGAFKGLLQAEAYPNNIEVTRDGRVLCGSSSYYTDFNFRLYTAEGTLLKGFKLGSSTELSDRQLVTTADGFTAAALAGDTYDGRVIIFVPLGAP